MIEVKLVKEGESESGPHEGKSFMEYGFSKEDHIKFHEDYTNALAKSYGKIEHLKHENPANYSMLADAIHQKTNIETFVPKLNDGLIAQLKRVVKGKGHTVSHVVRKNNGNVVFILNESIKKASIAETMAIPTEVGEVSHLCDKCQRTFKSAAGLSSHNTHCRGKEAA